VQTDADGLARAIFTPGAPGEHRIRARLGEAAVAFRVESVLPGPRDATRILGLVLDNEDRPLVGTTAWVRLNDGPIRVGIAGADGRFVIEDVPVGPVHLVVDASTAHRDAAYPSIQYNLVTVAGVDNSVGHPIHLPRNDLRSARQVGGPADVTLRIADVPGAELTVFADSVTCPDGAETCTLTWSQVRGERIPDPPPLGSGAMMVWTLQPPGVRFDPPARVCLPNRSQPPGSQRAMFSFDHDLADWVGLGSASVTADGRQLCTDVGFGIVKSGWGGAPPPPPPDNTCVDGCDDGNPCTQDSCQEGSCTSTPASDGSKCDDGSGCGSATCQAGSCVFDSTADDGTPCDDGDICTEAGMCRDGHCMSAPIECPSDDNLCTREFCDPDQGGCTQEPRTGLPCVDGDLCTQDGVCTAAGECETEPIPCPQDDTECATYECQSDTGECVLQPQNTGQSCGGDDAAPDPQCGSYVCHDDGTCGPEMGTPSTEGDDCDDGDPCTEMDRCMAGTCMGTPPEEAEPVALGGQQALPIPPDLILKANVFLNQIPVLGDAISFTGGTGGFSVQGKDCCTAATGPIENGEVEAEGSFSLGFSIDNLPIGPWSFAVDQDFDFLVGEVSLDMLFGIILDAGFSFGGSLGRLTSECAPGEDCTFGSASGSGALSVKAILEAIVCVHIMFVEEVCQGLSVTPAELEMSMSASATFNRPTCDSGLRTCFTAGAVTARASISLDVGGSRTYSISRQVFAGAQSQGCQQ
jgi:hypothetical protein